MKNLYSFLALSIFSLLLSAQNAPVAITDYATSYANEKVSIDVLSNDYSPLGNPLLLISMYNQMGFDGYQSISAGTGMLDIIAAPGNSGDDTVFYIIKDQITLEVDTGIVVLNILEPRNAAFLDINNVRALVNADGTLFYDGFSTGYYEVPYGGGASSIFGLELVVGGKDYNDSIYFTGKQLNRDIAFLPGPLDTVDAINAGLVPAIWDRVWKISKSEIEYHINHYWEVGYQMPLSILTWPAHGSAMFNLASKIAPFEDLNGNGHYEPQLGEYPIIKGDQAIYFIFHNPLNNNSDEMRGMGLEFHAMFYAYTCSSDSMLDDMTFIDYTVINRSSNTYHDAFLGIFADPDIGDASDDYVGTFVDVQSAYAYNADAFDGYGQALAYGDYPPSQSVTLLKGPLADIGDNIDNNFDGNIDENGETIGLTSVLTTTPVVMPFPILPTTIHHDYYELNGYWNDTLPIQWFGHWYDTVYSYPCRYVYPGNSDPLWIGTQGVIMNPAIWTEISAFEIPHDRRLTMGFGPFTFYPGQVKEMSIALVFANKKSGYFQDVVDDLHDRIEQILVYYNNNSLPCGGSFDKSKSFVSSPEVSSVIFPNPANEYFEIVFDNSVIKNASMQIFTLSGQCLMSQSLNAINTRISISDYPQGVYLVLVSNSDFSTINRLVVVH